MDAADTDSREMPDGAGVGARGAFLALVGVPVVVYVLVAFSVVVAFPTQSVVTTTLVAFVALGIVGVVFVRLYNRYVLGFLLRRVCGVVLAHDRPERE